MADDCPSAILAGVGVALELVQVLGSRLGFPHLWRSYTDFATLGTVADLMPMRDENRALVADGLARMNTNPRPCIAALLATTGQAGKPLSATNLSFSLIPRLNAAGAWAMPIWRSICSCATTTASAAPWPRPWRT